MGQAPRPVDGLSGGPRFERVHGMECKGGCPGFPVEPNPAPRWEARHCSGGPAGLWGQCIYGGRVYNPNWRAGTPAGLAPAMEGSMAGGGTGWMEGKGWKPGWAEESASAPCPTVRCTHHVLPWGFIDLGETT